MTLAALVFTLAGAYGVWLVYSAFVLGWCGCAPGPRWPRLIRRPPMADWMAQAGLADVRPREFGTVMGLLFIGGALAGAVLFDAPLPAMAAGVLAGSFPAAWYRARRDWLRAHARESCPPPLHILSV